MRRLGVVLVGYIAACIGGGMALTASATGLSFSRITLVSDLAALPLLLLLSMLYIMVWAAPGWCILRPILGSIRHRAAPGQASEAVLFAAFGVGNALLTGATLVVIAATLEARFEGMDYRAILSRFVRALPFYVLAGLVAGLGAWIGERLAGALLSRSQGAA